MKKNGFISMSLIYTFFLIFLSLMTFLITNINQERHLLNEYKSRIKSHLLEKDKQNNLTIYLLNNGTKKVINTIPNTSYVIINSTCDEKTLNEKLNLVSDKKYCEVSLQEFSNVTLNLYYEMEKIHYIPSTNYTYTCLDENINTIINLDANGFNITTDGYNECNIYFESTGDFHE